MTGEKTPDRVPIRDLVNFVIVATMGALYVYFGGLSPEKAIFYGVSPAVIALILHSCYRLTKLGMKDGIEWALAAAAFGITVAIQAEVAVLAKQEESLSPSQSTLRSAVDIRHRSFVVKGPGCNV